MQRQISFCMSFLFMAMSTVKSAMEPKLHKKSSLRKAIVVYCHCTKNEVFHQESDLVTFTEEIPNGKLHFCVVTIQDCYYR